MTLITDLDQAHQPNTPRTHDGQGHTVGEVPQCRWCLWTWPCEVHQLLTIIKNQAEEIYRLSDLVREAS